MADRRRTSRFALRPLTDPRATEDLDLSTSIGGVTLVSPVMAASGTAGHGAELASYLHLDRIGAVVTKSLRFEEWPGNALPRLHPTPGGMINAIGLQGPGVPEWLDHGFRELSRCRAAVVASIWGTTVDDYRRAAEQLHGHQGLTALEVNLSCPNLHAGNEIFAHNPELITRALRASSESGLPLWAKLSPNIADVGDMALAAVDAGAEAVTIANTYLGLEVDVQARKGVLGNGGGGVSGPGIRPLTMRLVSDTHRARPEINIIACGGISSGQDVAAYLLAGAKAVQVGTATLADPRAVGRIQDEFVRWCKDQGVSRLESLIGTLDV